MSICLSYLFLLLTAGFGPKKLTDLGLEDHDVMKKCQPVKGRVIELEDFWCSFESFVHFKDCFLMLLAPLNFSQLFPTSPKGVTSGVVSGWMRLMLKFCQIWIKPARRCNVHNGAPCCDDVCKWHRSLLSGVVGCGWEGWGWKMLKICDDWHEKALVVPTFHSNVSYCSDILATR